jgi:hypothetical protein
MVDLFDDTMDTSQVLGAIPANNTGSYVDLMTKLDTIIELLRAEKYAKMD